MLYQCSRVESISSNVACCMSGVFVSADSISCVKRVQFAAVKFGLGEVGICIGVVAMSAIMGM